MKILYIFLIFLPDFCICLFFFYIFYLVFLIFLQFLLIVYLSHKENIYDIRVILYFIIVIKYEQMYYVK